MSNFWQFQIMQWYTNQNTEMTMYEIWFKLCNVANIDHPLYPSYECLGLLAKLGKFD